jgi:hypothetical protein
MTEMLGKSSSEQPRKIKSEAIPQWAQGLYSNEGVFSEALVYPTTMKPCTSSSRASTAA